MTGQSTLIREKKPARFFALVMYIKLNSLQPLFEGFYIAFFKIIFGCPGNSKFSALNVLIVILFLFDPVKQHII
jgi:hypothetical protein